MLVVEGLLTLVERVGKEVGDVIFVLLEGEVEALIGLFDKDIVLL